MKKKNPTFSEDIFCKIKFLEVLFSEFGVLIIIYFTIPVDCTFIYDRIFSSGSDRAYPDHFGRH